LSIKKNLLRVIESLEYQQIEHYNSERHLTLSYLYDIRDNKVPKKLMIDRKNNAITNR